MELIQEFTYAGTRVSVSELQKTTREKFIKRFLPQLVFFDQIPTEEREQELGALWDMCNQEIKKEIEEEKVVIKKNNAISKRATRKVGNNAINPDSNTESN